MPRYQTNITGLDNMAAFDDDRELLATPRDFANEVFATNNKSIFDRYIELRVQGYPGHRVFRIVFGESYTGDAHTPARIFALENNPYYRREFPKALDLIKIDKMWNPKVAVHELISLVRDPFAKESARMSAMKELNVITKITIIDESGNTKPGRNLDDFYAEEEAKQPAHGEVVESGQAKPPTTH